jgi:hypothetical protein
MKILKFQEFLNEALKYEIPSYMSDIIKKRHGENYLDLDVPKHTDNIPNCKIEITDTDLKNRIINIVVGKISLYLELEFLQSDFYKKVIKPLKPFLKINYVETKEFIKFIFSKEIPLLVVKNNNISNPIYSNNKSTIYKFVENYNKTFPEHKITFDILNDNTYKNFSYEIKKYNDNIEDFINKKIYLYITDKPTDKLNMSVSNFYDSCMNIYDGIRNDQLLSNVFDSNSKLALIIVDESYTDKKGNTIPYTSIARCIIRKSKQHILFDTVYPNKATNIFYDILVKYTGLKKSKGSVYYYNDTTGLPVPYMDKFEIRYNDIKQKMLSEYLKVPYKDIRKATLDMYMHKTTFYSIYTQNELYIKKSNNIIDNILTFLGIVKIKEAIKLNFFTYESIPIKDKKLIDDNDDMVTLFTSMIIDHIKPIVWINENVDMEKVIEYLLNKYPNELFLSRKTEDYTHKDYKIYKFL